MKTLTLRLSPPEVPLWLRLEADGSELETGSGAPPDGAGDRVVLIVPGEDVVGHSLHLPSAGEAQTRAAARFAVEDELAADAAAVSLAIAPGGAGAPRLVTVTARAALESWLASARAMGVTPDAALPQWACVPAAPGECGVLVEDGVAHANFAGVWGFSAEADLAALLMARALERFDCARVTIWGDAESVASLEGWGGRELVREAPLDPPVMMALLARGAGEARLNLLQGEYAPRRAIRLDFSLWRRAAVIAAAVLGGWLALTVAEAGALNRQAAALRGEAEATFAQAFPDEARIVNPRLQMQTRLGELQGRGGGAFLDLASVLTAAAAAQDGVEIGAMRYQRADGALSAELIMSGYEDLQALRDTVAASGGVLDEGASRQAGGRVSAEVTVRLP